MQMREFLKEGVGRTAAAIHPKCKFDHAVFVMAHMRCGSTALSNVLCSDSRFSGYGEAHVQYRGQRDLGRLVVNQVLRKGLRRDADWLFDKILHNRHDAAAPPEFYQSRAIFLAREPAPSIRSIRSLFSRLGRTGEYQSDSVVAEYYIDRLVTLCDHWTRFDPSHRVGLTHKMLLAGPDQQLARISTMLGLKPPLQNAYVSHAASRRGGGGDPLVSARFNRIEPSDPEKLDDPDLALPKISADLMARCQRAYENFVTICAETTPQ